MSLFVFKVSYLYRDRVQCMQNKFDWAVYVCDQVWAIASIGFVILNSSVNTLY